MKIIKNEKFIVALLFSIFMTALISSCSSEDQSITDQTSFDHEHDEVTDLEKHKFEHKFADQCVARELENSENKAYDKQRYTKTCMCIAKYMMKDLTAAEAEKFLEENKHTRSLQIRFDTAAYHCLQKKTSPQSPTIFIERPKNVIR